MKIITFCFTLLLIFSCTQQVEKQVEERLTTTDTSIKVDVALKFANEYVALCKTMQGSEQTETWINTNSSISERFKKTYFDLLETARKEDPELGLGFDPILDAQDFPEKGFIIRQSDKESGYVTLEGNDWTDFTLVIRLVNHKGQTLVDGCGVINIDPDKHAKR